MTPRPPGGEARIGLTGVTPLYLHARANAQTQVASFKFFAENFASKTSGTLLELVTTPPVPGDPEFERQAQIVRLRNITRLDLDPDQVLQAAIGNLKCAIVIGYDADGDEYFASSMADGADVLWLLERCKLKLLRTDE